MTLTSLPKVKIFETYQLRKTYQNMLGYYAHGIIYCWRRFALYGRGASISEYFAWVNLNDNLTLWDQQKGMVKVECQIDNPACIY